MGLEGGGGMRIWPLFGTSNQILASLTLSIIAIMLIRKRRNPLPALLPLAFVFVMSFWAAIEQLFSFAEAEELLGALLFLLNNEAASFITGVVIPVDGGFSAYSGV